MVVLRTQFSYLSRWYDWYAFEVCEHLFDLLAPRPINRSTIQTEVRVDFVEQSNRARANRSSIVILEVLEADNPKNSSKSCQGDAVRKQSSNLPSAFTRDSHLRYRRRAEKIIRPSPDTRIKSEPSQYRCAPGTTGQTFGISGTRYIVATSSVSPSGWRSLQQPKASIFTKRTFSPRTLCPFARAFRSASQARTFATKPKHRLSKIPRRPREATQSQHIRTR